MTDKLNPLGETIRLIERERLIEAFNAIEAKRKPTPEPSPTPPAPRQKPNPAHHYRQRLRNAQDQLRAAEALLGRLDVVPVRGDRAEQNIPWSLKRQRAIDQAIKHAKKVVETESEARYLRGRVATYTRRLEELEGAS